MGERIVGCPAEQAIGTSIHRFLPERFRDVERIFEPFVQIDRRLTREGDGAGLGLAISRDLARGMGGELSVTSEDGTGSEFTLSLPRVPSAAGALRSR